jgi:hypothetical protein
MINREFNDWLETMNLEIGEGGRFFNSLPNQVYKMHIDKQLSSAHTDCVKINIIFDSYDTIMNWYNLKSGKEGYEELNLIGHPLLRYFSEDVEKIYTAEVNQTCLINAMIIHDLINGDNQGISRKCYSMPLIDSISKIRISWKDAKKRFKKYLI